ncbi:MAG: hypothetical protein KatS3mg103_0552 [Phycisphaerales bacterium]|nr:MAG: hypothetical protein KatS3mg103_0552 [Phycisphaerales bacterium]
MQWWTLASSLGVEGGLSLRFDQIADLLRVASTTARKLHPAGRVQVEIVDPFALYAARTPKTVPPLLLGELITQSGIHVDALGLRVDLTDAQTAGAVRDAMAFSEVLDRYAGLDRPISVTFMLAPSVPPADQDERGQWAGPWSPQAQADWARRMVAIAASKPYVHSICWGLVQDPPGRADGAGLVDASGAPRPALEALVQLRRGLREGALPLGR